MSTREWTDARAFVSRPHGSDLPPTVDGWSHPEAPGLVVTTDWDRSGDGTPVVGTTFSVTHAQSGWRLSTPVDPYRRAQFSSLDKAKAACLAFALCGDFARSAQDIHSDDALRHRVNIIFDALDTVPVSLGAVRCPGKVDGGDAR